MIRPRPEQTALKSRPETESFKGGNFALESESLERRWRESRVPLFARRSRSDEPVWGAVDAASGCDAHNQIVSDDSRGYIAGGIEHGFWTTMGRPREFEIDDAIETATGLFWRNGYEGTSLSDLTQAIGITPPSFYFAFGSKEALFRKIIERYFTEQSKIAEAALRKPTPRAVAKHFLNGYADMITDPHHAPGCLAMNSSLPCASGDPLREWLADLREQTRKRFRDRFAEARGGEGLPAGTDADSLARLLLVIAWGLAVEAQSGASRKDLRRTIALALPTWPDANQVAPALAPKEF